MSVQITDCTIRDGGYLLNKNSDPVFVNGVINGLVKAGIDYIETGFLQDKVNGETIVYHNSKDARKYTPQDMRKSELVGFCDNSRYSIENLDVCDGRSFTNLRISFAKHECESALKFCAAAKEKGYHIFVQPMDAVGYTFEERAHLIAEVNKIHPEALAIVDTFGAMYLEDLINIFKQMDRQLDKGIKIGLHTHNNLMLSCALAEQLISMAVETDRSVAVDGSLYGMGRGAGNANTEVIADYINKKYGEQYDLSTLLNTVERYLIPMREKVSWGYDVPMFICGTEGAHVDNIGFLTQNTKCGYKDMYEVINSMEPAERKRYGVNYSKTDFSTLQNAYGKFIKGENRT